MDKANGLLWTGIFLLVQFAFVTPWSFARFSVVMVDTTFDFILTVLTFFQLFAFPSLFRNISGAFGAVHSKGHAWISTP